MNISSYLEISEEEILRAGTTVEKIQEDLTLPNPEYAAKKRFGKGRYMINVPKDICYLRKRGENYILPRNYFGSIPEGVKDKRCEGRAVSFKHTIKLRDYQEKFCDDNNYEIRNSFDVVFNMPTGAGKTLMSIWYAEELGMQTLILVPTYYLARQWEQKIKEFTDATCNVLTPEDTELPLDSDFTIALLETLTVRELPKKFINNVGHLIVDEAHRSGAESYLPLLDIFPAKYRTALTATFRRADGVHKILAYHFGKVLKMPNVLPRPMVYGVKTGIDVQGVLSKNRPTEKLLNFLDLNFNSEYHETKSAVSFNPTDKIIAEADKQMRLGMITKAEHKEIVSGIKHCKEMSYTVLESYLNEHSGRRKLIINLIQKCLDSGRNVLFLAKRKDILKALHKYFAKYRPMLIVSETNKRTEEEEEYLQNGCKLILGVMQLAKEGLDVAKVDTLVISCGVADMTQPIGRIARLHPDKKYPIGFYFVDNNYMSYATFKKAQKTMEENSDFQYSDTFSNLKRKIRFAD